MHDRRIAEVHPDRPLNDQNQQDRHAGRLEGKKQHDQDDQNGDHADHHIIHLKGLFELVLVGGVAYHVDILSGVMALRCLPHRIREAEGFISGFRQRQVDQHAVIVLSFQLALAHEQLSPGLGQRVSLFSFQADIALIHLLGDVEQHIDQRDPVVGDSADQLVIAGVLHGIDGIKQLGCLIIQLQELRKLTRRELVRQLVAAHGIDGSNGRYRVYLGKGLQIPDQTLLLTVVTPGNHHGKKGAGGEGVADHPCSHLGLVLARGTQGIVAVHIGAVVGIMDGKDNQHRKHRRNEKAGVPGKAADKRNFGDEGLMSGFLHQFAEQHQEARHHQKHRKQ